MIRLFDQLASCPSNPLFIRKILDLSSYNTISNAAIILCLRFIVLYLCFCGIFQDIKQVILVSVYPYCTCNMARCVICIMVCGACVCGRRKVIPHVNEQDTAFPTVQHTSFICSSNTVLRIGMILLLWFFHGAAPFRDCWQQQKNKFAISW